MWINVSSQDLRPILQATSTSSFVLAACLAMPKDGSKPGLWDKSTVLYLGFLLLQLEAWLISNLLTYIKLTNKQTNKNSEFSQVLLLLRTTYFLDEKGAHYEMWTMEEQTVKAALMSLQNYSYDCQLSCIWFDLKSCFRWCLFLWKVR